MKKICAVVTNYGFEQNADALRVALAEYFPTVLIDASSPVTPSRTDIRIENSYYPGLWNASVEHARANGFEWMLFIASDVQVPDVDTLCHSVSQAIDTPGVGVYTASLAHGSRVSFPSTLNHASATLRVAGLIEGFFFVARTDILASLYPLPASNRFGWGVDIMTCLHAHQRGLAAVVDDRVEIFHPARLKEHDIDDDDARQQSSAYLGSEGLHYLQMATDFQKRGPRPFLPTASLDLGCGGSPRDAFGAQTMYGVDLRPSDDPRIVAADLSIEPIPFPDSRFEYVSAFDFIEHVPRVLYAPQRRAPFVELMNEIHRVLKPGGVFLSVTPAHPHAEAFQDPTHVNIITEETFPRYFCSEAPWARMYGFEGNFSLLSQQWDGPKLVTLLRARKPWQGRR